MKFEKGHRMFNGQDYRTATIPTLISKDLPLKQVMSPITVAHRCAKGARLTPRLRTIAPESSNHDTTKPIPYTELRGNDVTTERSCVPKSEARPSTAEGLSRLSLGKRVGEGPVSNVVYPILTAISLP